MRIVKIREDGLAYVYENVIDNGIYSPNGHPIAVDEVTGEVHEIARDFRCQYYKVRTFRQNRKPVRMEKGTRELHVVEFTPWGFQKVCNVV